MNPEPIPQARLSRGRRAAVLLLWLALLAAAAWPITHTRYTADLSAFLPAHPDPRQRVLIEQLQSGAPARTLLIGIDGGDAPARAKASHALAEALRASGLFDQVQNGERSGFADIGSWLFEHRYLLSPAVDPGHFSAAGLRDAITQTLSLLGTPAGNAIKPLLDRDPTGETQRIAEALIPSQGPATEEGVWAAHLQGGRALLIAGTRAAGADLDAQAEAIDRVRADFARLTASTPGLQLQLSGAPVFGVDSRARIEHEVRWLALAGTLLICGLLWLAFGSLAALGVAALPVATGVLAGIAAVALGFGSVHGMTLGFGTTLIGEAVDYAIYYLIQAQAAPSGWRAWLRSGWPTVRLGLWTSMCGFAALVFSGFPGLAQLGVFSLAGLAGAALTTRFVLPVLMPNGARSGVGLRPLLARIAAFGVLRLPRLRWPLLGLSLVALGLLLARGELWRADLGSLSPVSKPALALDASLRAELGAGDASALVVVQGSDLQATLVAAEAAATQLDQLVDGGQIGGFDSVTRWLPSLATQRARRASLPDSATLSAALAAATQGGPLPASRLAPFVAAVQHARTQAPITLQALHAAGLAALVDALLLQRADGSWAALLPLQAGPGNGAGNDTENRALDLPAVRHALAGVPGVQVLQVGAELTGLYQRYLREAQVQALLGALGVVLLMAFTLRSWRRLAAVCQPLLLAVLLTMGGLAALGVSLGILHLVGLLLVVAVGSNYALFFDLLRFERPPQPQPRQGDPAPALGGGPDRDMLASLLLANMTTVGSFGLIAWSSIPALSSVGRVVAPGALLALLLSAAFARSGPAARAPR